MTVSSGTRAEQHLFVLDIEIIDPARFQAVVPQHLAWLQSKFDDGTFVVSGRLLEDDGSPGVHAFAMLKAASLADAAKVVDADPFVVNEVCRVRTREFNPRMHTTAFGSIFSGDESKAVQPA